MNSYLNLYKDIYCNLYKKKLKKKKGILNNIPRLMRHQNECNTILCYDVFNDFVIYTKKF